MELTLGQRNDGVLHTETWSGEWTWYYTSTFNPEWRGFIQRVHQHHEQNNGSMMNTYRVWTNEKPLPSAELNNWGYKMQSITNGGRC